MSSRRRGPEGLQDASTHAPRLDHCLIVSAHGVPCYGNAARVDDVGAAAGAGCVKMVDAREEGASSATCQCGRWERFSTAYIAPFTMQSRCYCCYDAVRAAQCVDGLQLDPSSRESSAWGSFLRHSGWLVEPLKVIRAWPSEIIDAAACGMNGGRSRHSSLSENSMPQKTRYV